MNEEKRVKKQHNKNYISFEVKAHSRRKICLSKKKNCNK